jgi:hypothetical protein
MRVPVRRLACSAAAGRSADPEHGDGVSQGDIAAGPAILFFSHTCTIGEGPDARGRLPRRPPQMISR